MNDDDTAAALTSLFATVDPVPAVAMNAAYDAISWRDIDAELALLTFGVAADANLAHTRGDAPRLLTFTCGDVTIDVEVAGEDRTVRLLGQLDPPRGTDVRAESDRGSVSTRSDPRGRFQLDDVPSGRMRIVVEFDEAGHGRIATEWFHS